MPTTPANGSTDPPVTSGKSLQDLIGPTAPRTTDDPAWQAPREPTVAETKARAGIIHREIPLNVLIGPWDVPSARAAKQALVVGLFDSPSQMADAIILSDSRVQAGLSSRLSILGRPVEFHTPRKYRDSAAAKECRDAFEEAWPTMATEPAMSELQRWAVMMGFGIAQNLWDFSGEYAIPKPLPWHPRYTYYHWLYRCYVAITMDGQEPIEPGDGSWVLHAPHGGGQGTNTGYRAWMRGAIGAITPWWLGRNYALRDWMRHSEVFGMPIFKALTPAVGDPVQQTSFAAQLRTLGQGTVVHLPQNPDPVKSYDLALLEATKPGQDIFRMLIAQCNEEITLAIMGQTLTTSMPAEGGSSYAAARVHAGVLQGILEADARALALTVYQQIARPFAAVNFGNADLAPWVVWDVTPFEDAATKAQAFQQIANALNSMRTAGFKLDPKMIRRMIRETIPGFDPGDVEAVEPVQIEAQAARAGAKIDADGQSDKPPTDKTGARSRIARMMSRIDPGVLRGRIVDTADVARETMAEMEAAQVEANHEARRRQVSGLHEELGDLFGSWK